MRIAHFDSGATWRGGQAQVLLLLQGLKARGHDVVLLAPEGPLLERARACGVDTAGFEGGGELDLASGFRAARRLKPWRPDLLHAHTAHSHTLAVRSAARLGVPVVVSRRVLTRVGRNPLSRRKYAGGVARYLCISRAVADAMLASGIDPARLAIVHSAVDLDALEAVRQRVARGELRGWLGESLGLAAGALVGTAAALTTEKAPEVFLEAAAAVTATGADVHFIWLGDGPLRERVAREVELRRLGSRVHLPGFRADAREWIAQCDLFVSSSRGEGLGTAVLEAQALGVPVVACDSLGVRETIRDGVNGRLVPPAALGEAIAEALANPELRRAWASAALETVTAFGPAALVDGTLAEYAKVLGLAGLPAAG